jgi:voltage-gated potassium channel Kch
MAANADAPAGRCGFVVDVPGVGDLGAACCWRPTWTDGPRCAWYAPGQKSAESFADAAPAVGDRLDGATLRGAALGDARVNQGTAFGGEVVYEREFRGDPDRTRAAADAALWVYSELDRAFDANAVPDRALDYYVRERDLRRRMAWRLGEYATALRLGGPRWVMHYGTSPTRVLASSVVLMLVSAFVFPFTGGLLQTGPEGPVPVEYGESPLGWPGIAFQSLYFSAITFATLGYGDIQPVVSVARAVAAVESILGSVLMALLVFVLTRCV